MTILAVLRGTSEQSVHFVSPSTWADRAAAQRTLLANLSGFLNARADCAVASLSFSFHDGAEFLDVTLEEQR